MTRVLVSRQPGGSHPDPGPGPADPGVDPDRRSMDHDLGVDPSVAVGPGVDRDPRVERDPWVDHLGAHDPGGLAGLGARLGAAAAKLSPTPGGAPRQPLEVGRTTRVVQPAQRAALAVRDGGCVFPDCERLIRGPDGRFGAHPPDPGTHRPDRHRHPTHRHLTRPRAGSRKSP